MGVLSGLTMTVTVFVSSRPSQSAATELARNWLPGNGALVETTQTAQKSGVVLHAAAHTQDPEARSTALGEATTLDARQSASWAAYLKLASGLPGERELQQSFESSSVRFNRLSAGLIGLSPSDPAWEEKLLGSASERQQQQSILLEIESRIYAPVLLRQAETARAAVAATRSATVASYLGLAGLFTVAGVWLMRGAKRDHRLMTNESAALKVAVTTGEFEGSLQRGLEMEPTEEGTYAIITQALTMAADDAAAEMLLADSSQAHFRQVASSEPVDDMACRVGAPAQCPAASSGHTRFFPDSSRLDTCPFLRGRDDRVWAICAPVNVAGQTIGVAHAQQLVEEPPAERLAADLERIARKVGDRIGVIRVLTHIQTQAHVDPLTGLANRRTLENQIGQLSKEETPFVVAFADLDNFKTINDTHGHDTGDRALRLFARVLRDSLRPQDLVARYGGEEFVALLPQCSLVDARVVAERVRSQLANALTHASVPDFTVTIGLAAADSVDTFSDVVARADSTMLRAKTLGRDRVLSDGEHENPDPPEHQKAPDGADDGAPPPRQCVASDRSLVPVSPRKLANRIVA